MSNFKSGSGNLDFGGNEEDEEENDDPDAEMPETREKKQEQSTSSPEDQTTTTPQDSSSSESERRTEESSLDREDTDESSVSDSAANTYPYFVRRSNVGDERETRLEIHVRDKVTDQEAEFRNTLSELLETNEVSKTDAREFALLTAFRHPERVAELMRGEGYGVLD